MLYVENLGVGGVEDRGSRRRVCIVPSTLRQVSRTLLRHIFTRHLTVAVDYCSAQALGKTAFSKRKELLRGSLSLGLSKEWLKSMSGVWFYVVAKFGH